MSDHYVVTAVRVAAGNTLTVDARHYHGMHVAGAATVTVDHGSTVSAGDRIDEATSAGDYTLHHPVPLDKTGKKGQFHAVVTGGTSAIFYYSV